VKVSICSLRLCTAEYSSLNLVMKPKRGSTWSGLMAGWAVGWGAIVGAGMGKCDVVVSVGVVGVVVVVGVVACVNVGPGVYATGGVVDRG
jgi:hypothetical protein